MIYEILNYLVLLNKYAVNKEGKNLSLVSKFYFDVMNDFLYFLSLFCDERERKKERKKERKRVMKLKKRKNRRS